MADTRPIYGWCANAACPAGNNSVEVCNDPGCALTGMLHHAVENGCSSCREHPGKKGAGWWRPIGDGMANFLGMSDVPSASMLRVCPDLRRFPKSRRNVERSARSETRKQVGIRSGCDARNTAPVRGCDYAVATCYDYAVATCYDYAVRNTS